MRRLPVVLRTVSSVCAWVAVPALFAALTLAVPVHARTLTMPSKEQAALLHAYLANTPPNFDDVAAASPAVRSASEFDRGAAVARVAQQLRQDYLAMADVDRVVLHLRGRLPEYDAAAGGFALADFQSNRYIRIGSTRFVFDNGREFVTLKLPVDKARTVVEKAGFARSVRLEISSRPIAAGHASGDEVRMQVREVRITTEDGRLLGEMTTNSPEARTAVAGVADAAAVPEDRLDILGLKVGADPATYHGWAKSNGFEAHTVEEPFRYDWVARYGFTAVPGGLPRRSTRPLPPQTEAYSPMPIVGEGFTCGSKNDADQICGTVLFSGEPAIDDKRITTIRMSQAIIGRSPDDVLAKLTEKYGPSAESFDVVVDTYNRAYRGRQIVWGTAFPADNAPEGVVSFTKQKRNWQIEAVIFEPEANRTVLLLQVTKAPGSSSPTTEVRL